MNHTKFFAGLLALLLAVLSVHPVMANGPTHIVQSGDTLFSIATGYGVTVNDLVATNQLTQNDWLYPGQQLIIPGRITTPANQATAPVQWQQSTPRPTFQSGALPQNNQAPPRFPVYNSSYSAQSAQDLSVIGWTKIDQYQPPVTYQQPTQNIYQPTRPAQNYFAAPLPPVTRPLPHPAPFAPSSLNGNKWIDVDLSSQMLTAYEGQTPVFGAIVSTGLWQTPTVVGTYQIYIKYEQADMSGGSGPDAYNLPNVPYVMYFHGDYGLHGTYWHNNFGTPMSHGCVNLSILDSQWLYNWASVGTKVVTHY